MADYTKEVFLPSKGLFYPDKPELAGPIVIRMLTADDEKRIFGSQGGDLQKVLLQKTVVSPNFDPDTLVTADRMYLFMQLRIFTYGDDYHVKYDCPFCGAKHLEAKINLTEDLVVHELPADFKTVQLVALPVSKKEVALKFLTVGETNAIHNRAKMFAKRSGGTVGEHEYIMTKSARIVTVDGSELSSTEKDTFVKELTGRDSAYLEAMANKVKLGYDFLLNVTCPECGEEVETAWTPTSEFFRPRVD